MSEDALKKVIEEAVVNAVNIIREEYKNKPRMEGWLTLDDARKILPASSGQWQKWRDNRVFDFYQDGRMIWIKESDIKAYMKSKHVKKKETNF